MALVNCTECGKEVSDTALKCPSCGKQLRKPKRSFLGKIIKFIFIIFNLLMIYSVFAGLSSSGQVINHATSELERAGATIGTGIGVMMLGSIWVIGDIVIGILVFLTRPKG
ncbi:zinc ribbon domain-containing protein [Dickeya oryzae]|uniref:Zinc ribbon domain-containing protein n=1 Tax=Dickeya oryzae TaxID=1240404 RepID=A0AB39IKY5_9GAMM|nr:zinc ribbon domain-containing protein [Dickeya oryzae]MCA6997082.1 zinc ribbon domain-containing protein [Dickeya oryzae]